MRSAQLCASELKATLRDATHVGSSTTSSCASSALWGRTGGAAGSPRAVASSKWRGKGEGRRSTNAKRSAVRKHVASNAPRCEARRQQLDIERRWQGGRPTQHEREALRGAQARCRQRSAMRSTSAAAGYRAALRALNGGERGVRHVARGAWLRASSAAREKARTPGTEEAALQWGRRRPHEVKALSLAAATAHASHRDEQARRKQRMSPTRNAKIQGKSTLK